MFSFHFMNPNYVKEHIKIAREHNKLQNVMAIWDEPITKVQP